MTFSEWDTKDGFLHNVAYHDIVEELYREHNTHIMRNARP